MNSEELNQISQILTYHSFTQDKIKVRGSARAKRLIFTASVRDGIEIVVPNGARLEWVKQVIEIRLEWLRNADEMVQDGRRQLNPCHIKLKALGEAWILRSRDIKYLGSQYSIEPKGTLTVGKDPDDVLSVSKNLQKWLQTRAREFLIPWTESLARDRELDVNHIYVRNQATRWGSCSSKGNLSLNRNLLFLPVHLVEYVLQHELTHLRHLDHSAKFWHLLGSVVTDYSELRMELKSVESDSVPIWAGPRLNRILSKQI